MDIAQIVGPVTLFLLMMIVGLELTLDDFRRVVAMPRVVVVGTLAQWTLLPVMTWGVVTALDVNPVYGVGAILVAVAPGAGMSNLVAALGRGNIALSVTLTAITSVFAVVTLPAFASLGLRVFLDETAPVDVPVASLIVQLFFTLLLPIGLGMTLRTRHPERAKQLAPKLHRVLIFALLAAVVVGVAFAPEEQLEFEGGSRAVAAAFLWTVLAMAIGWGTATLLRLAPADRFTFVVEFGARNIGIAAIVAMSGLGRVDLTFFSGVYAAVGYPLVFVLAMLRRRRAGPTGTLAPPSDDASLRESTR
jgi:BASS family bile acid:Na+ symporter